MYYQQLLYCALLIACKTIKMHQDVCCFSILKHHLAHTFPCHLLCGVPGQGASVASDFKMSNLQQKWKKWHEEEKFFLFPEQCRILAKSRLQVQVKVEFRGVPEVTHLWGCTLPSRFQAPWQLLRNSWEQNKNFSLMCASTSERMGGAEKITEII